MHSASRLSTRSYGAAERLYRALQRLAIPGVYLSAYTGRRNTSTKASPRSVSQPAVRTRSGDPRPRRLPPSDCIDPSGVTTLRLRALSEPSHFEEGRDLLLPDGGPWHLLLARLFSFRTYKALRELLICDGLVPETSVDRVRELVKTRSRVVGGYCRPYGKHPFIRSLNQEFEVNLDNAHIYLWILDQQNNAGWIELPGLFCLLLGLGSNHRYHAPYLGSAVLRFERSTFPEHAGTRTIVLRIVRFTASPRRNPAYSGPDAMTEPREGELVMKWTRPVGRESNSTKRSRAGGPRGFSCVPWSYNPDKFPKKLADGLAGLRLLLDTKSDSEESPLLTNSTLEQS